MKLVFSLITLVLLIWACDEKAETEMNYVYLGPERIVEDLQVSYSDSGRVRVKVSTALQRTLQDDNEEYPKAIYVNFIDPNGVEYSSLRGDSGRLERAANKYHIMGNVFFYNRQQRQSLTTEELVWDPLSKKIYTNKKVTVNTPTDRITGNGMEAAEDFSRFKFTGGITGTFQVDSLITTPPNQ